MERYDYSNLLNAISNIKTENEVALNDRLASRKNKLAKLTNKVEQSGILEDWCNLQQTCRKLDIRLLPLKGYNSLINENEEQGELRDCFDFHDKGYYGYEGDRYTIVFKPTSDFSIKWFLRGDDFLPNDEQIIMEKIRILKEFEEEYEKYRDFQLKRIYAVMSRLTEKTEKIKSEI